jgi:hypothetical protein
LQEGATRTAASFNIEVWQQRWIELLEQLGWVEKGAKMLYGSKAGPSRDKQEKLSPEHSVSRIVDAQAAEFHLPNNDPGVTDMTKDLPGHESTWLLKKTVLHLGASLAEREQVVQALMSRLREHEHTAQTFSIELGSKEKIIRERDEAITWLQAEVAAREGIIRARDEAITWLQTRLDRYEKGGGR